MSNFIAVVTFANATVELKFNTISEYSDAYDELYDDYDNTLKGGVLSVDMFLNENYTNLRDYEFDFFKNFDEITYQLIEDFESGNYDQFCANTLELVAFEYLVENLGMDAIEALDRYEDVRVFEGTVEEYADVFMSEVYDVPESLMPYVNVGQFASDLERDGDIVDLDGYVITNGNEF